jgi:hypothetical protein
MKWAVNWNRPSIWLVIPVYEMRGASQNLECKKVSAFGCLGYVRGDDLEKKPTRSIFCSWKYSHLHIPFSVHSYNAGTIPEPGKWTNIYPGVHEERPRMATRISFALYHTQALELCLRARGHLTKLLAVSASRIGIFVFYQVIYIFMETKTQLYKPPGGLLSKH